MAPTRLKKVSLKEKLAMKDTNNLNGLKESNATIPAGAEATVKSALMICS